MRKGRKKAIIAAASAIIAVSAGALALRAFFPIGDTNGVAKVSKTPMRASLFDPRQYDCTLEAYGSGSWTDNPNVLLEEDEGCWQLYGDRVDAWSRVSWVFGSLPEWCDAISVPVLNAAGHEEDDAYLCLSVCADKYAEGMNLKGVYVRFPIGKGGAVSLGSLPDEALVEFGGVRYPIHEFEEAMAHNGYERPIGDFIKEFCDQAELRVAPQQMLRFEGVYATGLK